VGNALAQSPLRAAFLGTSGSSGAGAAPGMAATAGDNNSNVQGIGGGVQGMLNTGNALSADNMSDAMASARQRLQNVQALGSSVLSQGAWLWLATLQFVGFALAGVLAFVALRHVSYCDECLIFLSKKGEQTRYFNREPEIQGSVDEFLSKAKARRFRQSIEAHAGVGSKEKKKTSEFSSTVEISRCPGCHRHRLKFSARCKKGMSWKDISMLGYEAFCLEPIDVKRHPIPIRMRRRRRSARVHSSFACGSVCQLDCSELLDRCEVRHSLYDEAYSGSFGVTGSFVDYFEDALREFELPGCLDGLVAEDERDAETSPAWRHI
jgi:hypothetical protein